ncbi:hypothetical protein AMATHDRAFT_194702 [Amanita thiersii Skay4041]|uniref:Cytochrome P450 n=1 Tax=Amanita thiersii Skay4041 TaxID=703135 RepID=A0A2A9NPH1_9AGAR|nr:hypothetical protein AMATHDRAFT_194702 [Amanita thiersii Skay4041]
MPSVAFQLITAGLVIWLLTVVQRKISRIQNALGDLGDCPGRAILWLHPFRSLALVTGSFYPLKGQMGDYFAKFSQYSEYGSTCLSSVIFWRAIPTYFVADADAVKFINNERHLFEKDVEAYEPLNIYGYNIGSVAGSEWKRHRSIVKNAFNEANNAFVWSETCRFISQWFSSLDADPAFSHGEQSTDVLAIFKQIAFLVIASAGFGAKMNFNLDMDIEKTPQIDRLATTNSEVPVLSFGVSLTTSMKRFFVRLFAPALMYPIAKRIEIPMISRVLEETTVGFSSLKWHMQSVISDARDAYLKEPVHGIDNVRKQGLVDAPTKDASAALLRNLVQANMAEEAGSNRRLTDDELTSNTFVFLLAGHETTAHSLCFALILLAIHPQIQAKIYEEVCQLWPDPPSLDQPPAYKDTIPRLEYTTATFYEAIRLFSPVPRLGKTVLVDTTLKARKFSTNLEGKITGIEEYNIPLRAGSIVIVDSHGLHMNPIHWGDDVAKFKPERFIDTPTYKWPRDAYASFSQGHRSCIGQRFAITEGTCVLANLLRRYEVLLPVELESKPREEQERILLAWKPGVTIIPQNARVRLKKRWA